MSKLRATDIDLPALLATLRQWVEIETPTPDGARVNDLARLVEARALASGLHVERTAGQGGFGDILTVRSMAKTPASNRRSVLVLAHLDTVHPVGTLAGPLPWREEDGRIYGPGIYDMKAGALMALHALELVTSRAGDSPPDITLMFVPDEEMGSPTSRGAIESAARGADAALVVEPAREGGKIVVARKGVAMFDITVRGRASHAGTRPQDGRSAIRAAARIVLALEALNDPERGVTVTVGMIEGGTGRNVIPALCRLSVDARLPDAASEADILEKIRTIETGDPEISVTVEGGINRPAYVQSDAAKALFETAHALAADLGIDLVGMATGGGSDGNFTAALGVPTLDGLGADGAGAHTSEEYILVDSVAPRTALLANLLDAIA
ncbi:M20/M25/M40 family metallo-hydrolase [Aurantimonas aggregata]|uniref:M20/M25/M40 family metallo-hydrolase n=1 Tax=Aurantimonas aggregata TaxID=2047720 RepID=A0A6L9MGC2_9HYPH|nr:M20 family metallopeptidase [Aurantimonas aggregata]NDV86761.1 M20/M25/M40 family metallo-hydrolase [Aurantimonas aggregata]